VERGDTEQGVRDWSRWTSRSNRASPSDAVRRVGRGPGVVPRSDELIPLDPIGLILSTSATDHSASREGGFLVNSKKLSRSTFDSYKHWTRTFSNFRMPITEGERNLFYESPKKLDVHFGKRTEYLIKPGTKCAHTMKGLVRL